MRNTIHPQLHYDVTGVTSTGGLLSACFAMSNLRREVVGPSYGQTGLEEVCYCLDAPSMLPNASVAHMKADPFPMGYGQTRPLFRDCYFD